MPTDDGRRGEDRDHLPGVPDRIRNLIGQADDMLMKHLTLHEFELLANTDLSIDQLSKAKEELVRKVLARHGMDWRQRITPFEKSCLDRVDTTESSLRVRVALREMLADERLEHDGLEQQLGEAWQTRDELMKVAMERRGTDDSRP